MSLNQFEEGGCLLTARKHCPCVEFYPDDKHRHGFHQGQLLDYSLEPNDGQEKDAPPDKLTLAFATADVTLTGWRLDGIASHLRDGELLAVRSLPVRYAQLDPTRPAVALITVTPLSKS